VRVIKRRNEISEEDIYALKFRAIWQYLKGESFAFWMICGYLFFEYVRPQSIYPVIDFLPWTQITIIGAFLGCFTDKTVNWVSSTINKLLLIFFLVILVSSFFAYFPEISFRNLDKYYLWLVIYFLVISIVNTRKRLFIFLCIFLIASFKISLSLSITWAMRGFSFTDWGLKGPPGFFENSGELAIQMLVFWPISWAFAYMIKPYISKRVFRVLLLMPISAIMVILGASSRGAQLALVIQILFMNYKSVFKPKVLFSLAASLIMIWSFLPEEQKARFEAMGEDRTSQQRLLYWENGIQMIQDNPFLGVGYFNFSQYFEVYFSGDVLFQRAELPHNILIQVGTDVGLIGLSVFLLILLSAFKVTKKINAARACCYDHEHIARCFNISLLGFLVAGQFVTVTYYPFLWIHLALVVSLINSNRDCLGDFKR